MIKKGHLLTTLSSIPAEYVISFSVRPTAFSKGWSNVLHFTTGANYGKLGTRIPGVWFYYNKLHICGSVNGNANRCYNSKPLARNRWTDVKIVNSKVGSKYWYTVYVNGVLLGKMVNPSSRVYKNVKVYITDPWHKSFKGSLRNIQISAKGNFNQKFLIRFLLRKGKGKFLICFRDASVYLFWFIDDLFQNKSIEIFDEFLSDLSETKSF